MKQQIKYLGIITIAFIATLFICCSGCGQTEAVPQISKGDTELLIFGAPWCPPCNKELRELGKKIPQEFKTAAHKYVVTVWVVEGERRGSQPDEAACLRWKDKLTSNFTFLPDTNYVQYRKYYGNRGPIPGAAAIDNTGKVLKVFKQGTPPDELVEFLHGRID